LVSYVLFLFFCFNVIFLSLTCSFVTFLPPLLLQKSFSSPWPNPSSFYVHTTRNTQFKEFLTKKKLTFGLVSFYFLCLFSMMMVRIEEFYFSSNIPVCVCIICECVCMLDVRCVVCASVSGFWTIRVFLNCMRMTVTVSVCGDCLYK
jgi:hypothetical protein